MPVENNPQTPEDLNANWPLNSDHVKEGAAHIRGVKAVIKSLFLDVLDRISKAVPSGTIITYGGANAPVGYAKCEGQAISRTAYPELFAAIGTSYGAGNGTTTFNVPDLRNQFVRGASAERAVSSYESDSLRSHAHTASSGSAGNHSHGASASSTSYTGTIEIPLPNSGTGADTPALIITREGGGISSFTVSGNHTHSITVNGVGDHSHSVSVEATGGTETRPANIALLYCIKL